MQHWNSDPQTSGFYICSLLNPLFKIYLGSIQEIHSFLEIKCLLVTYGGKKKKVPLEIVVSFTKASYFLLLLFNTRKAGLPI